MLGTLPGNEHSAVAPQSFAVDNDGNIYIADLVNERVTIYSPEGKYLRSLPMRGTVLNDIFVSEHGDIYTYDHSRRTIFKHDAQGSLIGSLELAPNTIDTRGYFHLVNDELYFADAGTADSLLATIQRGMLLPIEPATKFDGIRTSSGHTYAVGVKGTEAFLLNERGAGTERAPLEREVPVVNIASAEFIGEDKQGRLFVKTERWEAEKIVVELHSLDRSGRRLTTTKLPSGAAYWTAKTVSIMPDGAIAQFLPLKEQASLNLFRFTP